MTESMFTICHIRRADALFLRISASAVATLGCNGLEIPSTLDLACHDLEDCNPGQMCVPNPSGSGSTCKIVGNSCDSVQDCDAGHRCVVNPDGVGSTCHARWPDSCGASDCPPDPYECVARGAEFGVCETPDPPGTSPVGDCNPFAQDCEPGSKCVTYLAMDGEVTTQCVPASPAGKGLGAACTPALHNVRA